MDETDKRFSLKWSDFRSNLTEGFHDLLEENSMVDVTLAADGKFVQAHKLVLSVCSPYFKNLFKVNPCQHPIVILKDVGHNELSDMIQFMYKGEVGVRHQDLPAFLKLADTLKVKGLATEKMESGTYDLSKKSSLVKARVRKKRNKISIGDCDKENSESHCLDDAFHTNRKRRQSTKSVALKKVTERKRCKVDSECVNVKSESSVSDDDTSDKGDSDDEVTFDLPASVVDEIKCDSKSVSFESGCDVKNSFKKKNESENSQTVMVNKTGYLEDDADSDNNDNSGDLDNFEMSANQFDPNNSTEIDQTPQGHISSLIISRAPRAFVWDYFLKETHQAICLNCGKTFKGQRPNTICEQHLKRMHPEFYKILLEKKIKRAELHMNPVVMGLGIPSYDHD
ncbi:hypothetical protein RUM44_009516 [Polyplax serrata]|uniref:BTB domain-containing protein n=1 Tax=Polyplax serrata TaxID=468196 RepID=A0ABR1ASX9_POLSC